MAQKAPLESVATTRQLSEQNGKIGDVELKFRLLTDDPVAVLHLNKQSAAWDAQITVVEACPET